MNPILWLELKTFKKALAIIIAAAVIAYPLLIVMDHFDLKSYLGQYLTIFILLVPYSIQNNRFKRKILLDYHFVTSNAREILLIRGGMGAVMALLLFILLAPAIFLAGGSLIYSAISVLTVFFLIIQRGYASWYEGSFISASTISMILIIIVSMMIWFPERISHISILVISILGISSIYSLMNVEKKREEILR